MEKMKLILNKAFFFWFIYLLLLVSITQPGCSIKRSQPGVKLEITQRVPVGVDIPQTEPVDRTRGADRQIVVDMSLKEIREMIKKRGHKFSVGETSVSKLTPHEKKRLCGFIPVAIENNRMIRKSTLLDGRFLADSLPTSFNWTDSGGVTPARNQGQCGSCWAFAAIGDLESKILINEGTPFDLSEQNLLSCNFFGYDCYAGGNYFKSTNFLTKIGPSLESCAPYQGINGVSCDTTCDIDKVVTGWKRIADDTTTIKAALHNNGPISTSMYASDPSFHAYREGVYEYTGSETPDHAVLIVGWDDTLGTNGAWIVKNSWGTNWGMDGYFHIAYGSARIGESSNYISSYKGKEANELLLHYDDGGYRASIGFGNNTSCYGAVIFTPPVTGSITAVDFWAVAADVSYEIEIYDGMVDGEMENLLTSQSGSCEEFGYYSIDLDDPVHVTNGDAFVVSVKFTTTGYNYPVPIDRNNPVESGKHYLSLDGLTWLPIGANTSYPSDIAIRARMKVDPEGGSEDDTDVDGVINENDKCPEVPNGPDMGTCSKGDNSGDPCFLARENTSECGDNGFCSMDQEDSDSDWHGDVCDNCPETPNPDQEDNYPPQKNNCGDACDCEGDVHPLGAPDGDVDGSDAFEFKQHFGRSDCVASPPCLRDHECDGDVDGSDAFKFKMDFGRSDCPDCTFSCPYE